MITLPPTIQDHLLNLHSTEPSNHATEIIKAYFTAFTPMDAQQELWLLLTIALTAPNAPNTQQPQERQHLIHFYEYSIALITAVERSLEQGSIASSPPT